MKALQKLLMSLVLIVGIGTILPATAAGTNLPEIAPQVTKAETAKRAFKTDATCTKCHDENEAAPVLSIYQTKHGVKGDPRTPNCQSCHGDSAAHLKGAQDGKGRPSPDFIFKKGVYEKSNAEAREGQCLTCHKGGKRSNWDGAQHQVGGVACNDCHVVHRPADPVLTKKTQTQVCYTCHKDQRADSYKFSTHPIEVGKVVCSDCHNPHGSTGPKLLKKNTLNETCWTCHAEKRGPMRFEHQPVMEDCSYCHTPHGSNISPLLKDRPPMLCQECHDGTHGSGSNPPGPNIAGRQTNPGITSPSSSLTGRACMNCHVMVHGSNSPAGGYLQR